MGKGNRERLNKAHRQADQSSVFAKKTRKQTPTWVWTLTTILIVVLLLSGVALNVVSNGGYVLRWTKVVQSESYSVDAGMMSYYLHSYYQGFLTEYKDYLSYIGLDPDRSLKSQTLPSDESKTWFDYFMVTIIEETEKLLVYCEEADARGIKLDDKDREIIDEAIQNIRNSAKDAQSYGYTLNGYISAVYGKGVKLGDIKRALQITQLASKCGKIVAEEIRDGVTDGDIDAYYDDNKTDFWTAKFLSYAFEVDMADPNDEDYDYESAKAKADERAAALVACKTEEEFKRVFAEFMADDGFDTLYEAQAEKYSEDILPDEEELKAHKAEITAAAVRNALEKKAAESIDSEDKLALLLNDIEIELTSSVKDSINKIKTPAFAYYKSDDSDSSDDENEDNTPDADEIAEEASGLWISDAARAPGDTTSIQSVNDTTKIYTVTAYMILEPMHRDDTVTRNIGHILFAFSEYDSEEKAFEKAEEILAEFRGGEMTRETFEELGLEHTDDSSVFYDNVTRDYMVEEFEDWLFDPSRKEGDTGIVKTEYGCHIMYYLGESGIAWRLSVKDTVASERSQEWYEEKFEQFGVTSNAKRADRVVA